MSGLIMAGDVLLDRKINGQYTGFFGPLNSPETTLTANDGGETLERKSNRRDTFGQNLDAVVFPGDTLISISVDDADPEVLELFFLGDLSDVSIEAGSVAEGSPIDVVAHKGKWSRLDHRKVSTVVVKNAAGDATYVLDTDYVLDTTAGLLKILPGSAIVDGVTLKVSYAYAAQNGKKIVGATSTEVRCRVLIDGKNLTNQKEIEFFAHEAVLTPSGETRLVGGREYWQGTLSGKLITPDGEDGPYTYKELS